VVGTTDNQGARKDPLQAKLVERVLAMLSPEERLALVLRHTRRLSPGDIARQLKCPRAVALGVVAQAEAKVRAAQRALIEAIIEVKPQCASGPAAKKRSKVRAVDSSVSVEVAGA
jgi:DNA-directed RNA polymerase specialized sigma24 family protein